MPARDLDDIPMLQEVIDLQQALSGSQDLGDLIRTFAERFHRLYGVDAVLGVDVSGLAPGAYRVMDFIDASAGVSRDSVLEHAKWDLPREAIETETGGIVSQLITGTAPSLLTDAEPSEDLVLSRFISRRSDIVSIPVFRNGEHDEWFLVFRPPGKPLDPVHVRLFVSMFNMFSRLIVQFKLAHDVASLNEQLDAKLREVAKVQRSILPASLPAYDSVDVAVHYQPSDLAGGDYYDFRTFGDGSMGVVIADVSGHGPGAAVVMAMLRTVISIDRVLHAQPDDIVHTINRFMWDGLTGGTFVTAFFLKLCPESGRADYVSAGHWPALVRKPDGRVVRLDQGSGPPIGMIEDITATGGTAQLEPGDMVLLYTDGITEAFSPDEKTFGEAQLIQTLQHQAMNTPDSMLDAVRDAVSHHSDGRLPDDDQCMVALCYRG